MFIHRFGIYLIAFNFLFMLFFFIIVNPFFFYLYIL